MKRLIPVAVAAIAITAGVFWLKVMHFLGWDGQTSDYYAAWSSSIPALITLVGMSTLFASLWHGFNCHEPGCWRWGKHKVSGTPWCNRHHNHARPERRTHELLESIEGLLKEIAAREQR